MLLMKKYKQLTSEQRYAIYLGLENGDTQRTIASLIGVSPSAVSRELQRNKDKRGGYSWRLAHEMAMERRERLPGNRATPEWIKQKVIREDKKAGGDLYKHCRHRLKHRKRPVGSVRGIPNRRSIRERPVEADGKRFGDFEMDTMIGADQSEAILTVTERKTNLVMIGELPRGRDSKGLAKVLCRMLLPYKDVIRTITTDNGLEFAAHERITEMLEAPVYFTDPYSAWQKGSIENANKLIRQYIPKGASFKDYPPDRLKRIQHRLNERPRKKLDFNTPKVEFYKQLM
jgi:IS30 family transposase